MSYQVFVGNNDSYVPFALICVGFLIVYNVALVICRIYFHPLSHIPGPKIAAATQWYEFYFDVIKGGQYVFKIEDLHKRYGPIIRINPSEVVINDADFYDSVYVVGATRRTGIPPEYRQGIGLDGSHAFSADHDLHKRRRKPLEPFFSPRGIEGIEQTVIDIAKLMSSRLEAKSAQRTIVRLDHVFSAFTGDMIGCLCTGQPPSMLKEAEYGADWHNLIERIGKLIPLLVHLPVLVKLVRMIPASFLRSTPGAAGFNQFEKLARQHIEHAKEVAGADEKGSEVSTSSLFHRIASTDMPRSELSTDRLSQEATVLLGAGTLTVARTLSVITYCVLRDLKIRERLTAELSDSLGRYPEGLPRTNDLKKLPYLQAVVKEGLRLGVGVLRRLPRTSPDQALQYKQYTIPRNTSVGMGAWSLHMDPVVYPEPEKFIPERWLGDIDPRMNRNWVPFSRGSRNCLGINLANAEMSWALAVLFRPNGPGMALFQTEESDVVHADDYGVPMPKRGSRGLRVMIGGSC